jgi:hypothetical protein
MVFILGFCILLSVFYQGYWKNRPSQQLFAEININKQFKKLLGGTVLPITLILVDDNVVYSGSDYDKSSGRLKVPSGE